MNVFLTRKIHPCGLQMLKEKYQVDVYNGSDPISRDELIARAKDADAVITVLTEKIDKEILDLLPNVKIFANYAIGYDNFDLQAFKEKEVFATNTPGNLAEAVAEFTIGLLLTLTKNILKADTFIRAGNYVGWDPSIFISPTLKDKTLGLIGTGRIGAATAHKAHYGLGMNIQYYDVMQNQQLEINQNARKVDLETLIKTSDVISLHVPLLDSTKHLISKEQLEHMKNAAFIINTARGPVINEYDLVHALKNNKIAGAALDVFEFEPTLAEGLTDLENVVLTPHIASATEEARSEMAVIAATNIIEALEGRIPPHNLIK